MLTEPIFRKGIYAAEVYRRDRERTMMPMGVLGLLNR